MCLNGGHFCLFTRLPQPFEFERHLLKGSNHIQHIETTVVAIESKKRIICRADISIPEGASQAMKGDVIASQVVCNNSF